MGNQPEELGRFDGAEKVAKSKNNGVLEQRRKRMGVKKSDSEMVVIREIEKAVLTGLKKEGCQRAKKDCEMCPLAVLVENEGAWLCKPGDLLKTVKGWQRADRRQNAKERAEK